METDMDQIIYQPDGERHLPEPSARLPGRLSPLWILIQECVQNILKGWGEIYWAFCVFFYILLLLHNLTIGKDISTGTRAIII